MVINVLKSSFGKKMLRNCEYFLTITPDFWLKRFLLKQKVLAFNLIWFASFSKIQTLILTDYLFGDANTRIHRPVNRTPTRARVGSFSRKINLIRTKIV